MANKPFYTPNDGILNYLTENLFNSMNAKKQASFLQGHTIDDEIPLNIGAALGPNGATLKDLGTTAIGAATNNPFKTAGLVGLGAGNIGGLTDNDKFGGQLGGLALGGLGAATFASGNPYLAAMLTMGGGELGALFDKLRAKKEQPQYYGGR